MIDTSYFRTHDLALQQRAELMKRKESKFLLPRFYLDDYCRQLSQYYSVLQIDQSRLFSYQSLYFDTHGMDFYRMHHNGKLARHKVRLRCYLDTNDCFLEVKTKKNNSTVSKQRVLIKGEDDLLSAEALVSHHTLCDFSLMAPSLYVEYQRCTFLSQDFKERVTIDTNIQFCPVDENSCYRLTDIAVIEVKRQSKTKSSLAFQLLRLCGVKETSFSKYCIGLGVAHRDGIKINRFKPILKDVEKMVVKTQAPLSDLNEDWYKGNLNKPSSNKTSSNKSDLIKTDIVAEC